MATNWTDTLTDSQVDELSNGVVSQDVLDVACALLQSALKDDCQGCLPVNELMAGIQLLTARGRIFQMLQPTPGHYAAWLRDASGAHHLYDTTARRGLTHGSPKDVMMANVGASTITITNHSVVSRPAKESAIMSIAFLIDAFLGVDPARRPYSDNVSLCEHLRSSIANGKVSAFPCKKGAVDDKLVRPRLINNERKD